MIKKTAGILIILLLPVAAVGFEALCVRVVDGDTIRVRPADGKTVAVRLFGIDCPEKDQPRGADATAYTRAMALGKIVDVETLAWDRYGRIIGRVRIGRISLNVEIIAAGLAWPLIRSPEIARAHLQAREHRRGIWSDPAPVHPEKWRKR